MNQLEILLKLKNETQAGFAQLEKSLEGATKNVSTLNSTAASSTKSLGDLLKSSEGAGGAAMGLGKSALIAAGGVVAVGAAAIGALGAVRSLTAEFAAQGSSLVDLKNKTGVGVAELQKLMYVAKQSGVENAALTTSLMQMEKAAAKSPELFQKLGISIDEIRKSKPDELVKLIAEGMSGLTDQNQRALIAMQIFGRGGSEMLKMLTADYKALYGEAGNLGFMTDEMAERGDRLDDAFSKLDATSQNLKLSLSDALANPTVIAGVEELGDFVGWLATQMRAVGEASRNASNYVKDLKDSLLNLPQNLLNRVMGRGMGSATPDFENGNGSSAKPHVQTSEGYFAFMKGQMSDSVDQYAKALKEEARVAEKAAEANARLFEQRSKALGMSATPISGRFGFWDDKDKFGINTLPAGDPKKVYNFWGDQSKFRNEFDGNIHVGYDSVADKARLAAISQEDAAESAARWAGALQGVALMAGAIGGKLGNVVGVMENIGKSFERWGDKDFTKFDKFNAVAGGVGQIGGLIGGTGGSAIQGAAGGAMTGFALGGPLGALAGGAIGGIMGIFGGKSKAKAELAELKAQLGGLADEAKRFGISLDTALASKNSNVVKAAIEEVNRAMEAQQKRTAGLGMAAGGLNAFVGGGGVTDQASADRSGLYATAIFGNMVKDTGDVAGALQAIGPALAEIAKKAEEMGLSLGAGVANLIGMNNVLSGNEGLAQQVSGLNQMMKGLADANIMNRDLFAALGADATAVFNQLIAGGATGNQALALMQPTLQQLYEGQKLYGFAVDEATQKLIDEAKAQGLVGDAFMSANERMVELLGILIETLGGTLPAAYKRAGDAAEEYGQRAANSMPTGYHVPPGIDDGGDAGFASGTAFRNFGAGTRTTLHGEEAVMTRPQVDRLVSMAVSGGGSSAPAGGGGGPIMNQIYVDGRLLLEVMTNGLRTDGREAQDFRQAYSGAR